MATSTPLLCEPADLATKLGVAATDPDLLVALRAASNRFRGAVRHQVHRVTETLHVNAGGELSLRLPVAYVHAVETVEVDDRPVTVDWDEYGLLDRRDGQPWPNRRRGVTITLTHGFDPIPDDIAEAVQDQAEAGYNLIRGLSSKQVGGITLTYGAREAIGTTEQWQTVVDRYRIRSGDRA